MGKKWDKALERARLNSDPMTVQFDPPGFGAAGNFECTKCHQKFTYAAGLREHLKTSATCFEPAPNRNLAAGQPTRYGYYGGFGGWLPPLPSPDPPIFGGISPTRYAYKVEVEKAFRDLDDPANSLLPTVNPALADLREKIRELEQKLDVQYEYYLARERVLEEKVIALEKIVARAPSLDAVLHRAVRDPIDYAEVAHESEDLLEDGYRWPAAPKPRVKF